MNRHPAVLARMIATLADQSGGRVELGIGVGGYVPELAVYGIRFPERAERVQDSRRGRHSDPSVVGGRASEL